MGRNILVMGREKTGTTGVYSLIKSALLPLANEYFFSFEPVRSTPLEQVVEQDRRMSVLTKIMYKHFQNFELGMFDRRVMTVRDPRDILVSTLLFRPLLRTIVDTVPMQEHERFLEGLKRKEQDPQSVSILELADLGNQVGYKRQKPRRLPEEYLEMADLADERGFHVMRYEEFVDGKVEALSDYLQLPLNPGASETPSWLTHISRSRGHGAWRDWLTPKDVEFYRPLLSQCMERMGYENDWDLNDSPQIPPETSSMYVLDRIIKRRRELAAANSSHEDGASDAASIATLHSMASDGNAKAALELARRLNLQQDFGSRWPVSARYWARQAELQGLSAAAELRQKLDSEIGLETSGSNL